MNKYMLKTKIYKRVFLRKAFVQDKSSIIQFSYKQTTNKKEFIPLLKIRQNFYK